MTKLSPSLSFFLAPALAFAANPSAELGLRLLNRYSAGSPSSLAVSPWGLTQSLALLREASRGDTRAQIENQSPAALPEGSGLKVAYRLWIQQDYQVQKKFQDAVKKNFAGAFEPMDLLGDTAIAVKAINAWTATQTDKRVPSVLREEEMEEMLLTSAFAWRSSWGFAVDRKETKPADFVSLKGAKKKASFMKLAGSFRGASLDDADLVELPLATDGFALLVFIPKDPKGLVKLEKSMSVTKINDSVAKLAAAETELALPRFKMNAGQDFIPFLKAAGISAMFAKGADFSGITGTKELFLHRFQHRVAVEVDENSRALASESPEASPAPVAEEPRKLRADHPFYFVLRHAPTEQLLIAGRVMNP